MIAGIRIIAASASAAPAPSARVGDRLRHKPGRIELGHMRIRRGGRPLGRLILCARFRLTRRRIIVRRLQRPRLLERLSRPPPRPTRI